MLVIVHGFDYELGTITLLVDVALRVYIQVEGAIGGKKRVVPSNFAPGVIGDTGFNAVFGVDPVFVFDARRDVDY